MISERLFDLYQIDQEPQPERFGNGLINDTYLVYCKGEKNLLQRINHKVFKNPQALANNLHLVCSYVKTKFPKETFISVVPTHQGDEFVQIENTFWRMLKFIPDTHSYESLTDPAQALEAGKVIGHFHTLLGGMDVTGVEDTIPHFHNLEFRINQFHQAINEDKVKRVGDCKADIEFLKGLTEEVLAKELKSNLPVRVVHNDTKLNNILFDPNNQGVCLVDLDTLMKGYITFDTGDALRTLCNPSGEDGSQAPPGFNEPVFLKFVEGYLQETITFLKEEELQLIPFSMLRMSTEQCIRFLSDHLNGDIYYHQPYPGFNLKAVETQIRFIRLTQERETWMAEELDKILHRLRS